MGHRRPTDREATALCAMTRARISAGEDPDDLEAQCQRYLVARGWCQRSAVAAARDAVAQAIATRDGVAGDAIYV